MVCSFGVSCPYFLASWQQGERGAKTKGTGLDERIEGNSTLKTAPGSIINPFYRCFITWLFVFKTQTSLDEILAFTGSVQGNKTQGKIPLPPWAWLLLSYITDKTNKQQVGFPQSLSLPLLLSIFSSWLKVSFYKPLAHNPF